MSIQFEDPDPALEFNLLENYPDNNFNVFTFDADSLYQLLFNTPDSTELNINLDGDTSLTIVMNNFSIYVDSNADSTSYSKKGYIAGEPQSSVACHFSGTLFWMHILMDSIRINIGPVKMHGSNFANYENLYVITYEDGEWHEDDISDEECTTFKIEVGVFVDPEGIAEFQDQFDVEGLGELEEYIEEQIIALDKFLNDEISEFTIELKLLRIEFLNAYQTRNWDYIPLSTLNRHVDSEWNYPNCIKPDFYILYTGNSLGGGHGTPGVCNPDVNEDPGLALVPFRSSFGNSGSETAGVTVFLAHEVCHLLGAGEGEDDCGEDCEDNIGCTPANLMCQFQCSASHAVSMNLFPCSINKIHTYLESRCEDCFTSFSDSDCNFCSMEGKIRTPDKLPLVKQCENRDTINVYFTFSNDCDERNVEIRAIYYTSVVERIGGLGEFTSEVIDSISLYGTLFSPTTFLEPGASVTYSARFKLVENPSGMGYLPNIAFNFVVFSGSTQIFSYSPAVHFKYVKPEMLIGTINLSDIVEPNSGYILHVDNVTGCAVSNPPIHIDGVLNVDQDHCLNNTWIIMGEGSKISVKSGNSLTINTDKILGCSSMWDAIEVEDGARLVINESSIEDAMAAVRLEENTSFTSTETKYYNNLYGITAPLNELGDIEFNVLSGNSFMADDTLSKDPVSGFRAKAGIWLDNVNEAYIHGEPPHIEPGMNIFSNMKNGIVLTNTDASIQNFHIYDISDGPDNIKEVDEQPDGHGIYVYGSSGHFTTAIGSGDTRDNYIKAQRGIFVKDANADIQYCNIKADLSAIILGYSNNREVNILNNLINAQYRGISLRLPIALEATISGNRITMPTSNGIGIQCLSSWKDVKITDNLLFLNSSREGIGLTDCKSTYVEGNRIIFEDIGEHQMKGISLEASAGNIIFDNHVIGKNKDHNTVGIYTQDSPANTILCNEVKMANKCYQFAGVSSLTNFHTNNHLTSDFGLLLGSNALGSDAIIGPQSHKENLWLLTNYGEKGAWILTEDPKVIEASIFDVDVDDNQNQYYPPNIIELEGLEWFFDIPAPEYSFDCQNLPSDLPDLCCNFSIPNDTIINFDTYPEVKDLRLRKQLYGSLRDELIDTIATSSLYNFFTKSDTMTYGRLIDVRQLYELASISSAGSKASNISAALTKNSQIPDTLEYLLYETEANELLAEYLDEGDLGLLIEDSMNIQDRAALCPYEYGDGVYIYRSWLRAFDLKSEFDEEEFCGFVEPRSSEKEGRSLVVSEEFNIWPNPSRIEEQITIQANFTISDILISDVLGRQRTFASQHFQNKMQFDFTLDQPGFYVITIWNDKGQKYAGSLIVID